MKGGCSFRDYRWVMMGFLIPALLLLGNFSAYAGKVRGVSDDTIKVAVLVDLTGPAAQSSTPYRNAFRDYFGHLNEQGTINGRKIKLVVEDDRYSIPVALAAFKKVVFKDKVFAMFGPSGTGHTVALFKVVQKNKIPNFTQSTSEAIINPFKRYLFTTGASYQDQFKVIFDYIAKDLKAKNQKIAYVGPDNEFGKVGLRASIKRAKRYGLNFRNEVLNFGSMDATTQVLSLKRARVKIVVINEIAQAGVAFLRTTMPIPKQATFIISDVGCDGDTLRMSGQSARGLLGSSNFNPWHMDTPGMVELRKVALKNRPKVKSLMRQYVHGWVAGMVLEEGIKKAGRDLDEDGLIMALESMKDFDTKGLSGLISFSSDNHKGGKYYRLFKADIEKNAFNPITEWRKPVK